MNTNKKGGCSRPPLDCSNSKAGNAVPRNKYKEKRHQLKELIVNTDYSIIKTHIGIPKSQSIESPLTDKIKIAL